MELTQVIRNSVEDSVLCWLATSSSDNIPNVSPKEIFKCYGSDKIILAKFASPKTVSNIKVNRSVSLSMIDILVQKGFQLKGAARIVDTHDPAFMQMEAELLEMTGGKFPFKTITEITIQSAKPILAPRYILYPETTVAEQIISAKKTYGLSYSELM